MSWTRVGRLIGAVAAACVGLASLLALAGACSNSSTSGDESTWCTAPVMSGPNKKSPDSCTTALSPTPAFNDQNPNDSCVQCTARCGASKIQFAGGGSYYTDTDLPSGACTTEGELCDLEGTAPLAVCNGRTVGCAVNFYRCSCTNGQWSCAMVSQGGGTCGDCPNGEGGVDSGG